MQTPRTDPTLTLQQRQELDQKEVEHIRAERERAERLKNAQPITIAGVAIPFWKLVWWLVGITAGIKLINAAFDWAFRLVVGLFAGG